MTAIARDAALIDVLTDVDSDVSCELAAYYETRNGNPRAAMKFDSLRDATVWLIDLGGRIADDELSASDERALRDVHIVTAPAGATLYWPRIDGTGCDC